MAKIIDIKSLNPKPILFLDRDGTINIDMGPSYLNSADSAKLIPGVGRAIVKAQNAGFLVAIITNQAGVAKGITPKEVIPQIHERLEQLIALDAGVEKFQFDDIQVCYHHPDDQCKCRKPETGLVEKTIARVKPDLEKSFFIGDKSSDILCGIRLGIKPILVLTGHGIETRAEFQMEPKTSLHPFSIQPSLIEAIDLAIETIASS